VSGAIKTSPACRPAHMTRLHMDWNHWIPFSLSVIRQHVFTTSLASLRGLWVKTNTSGYDRPNQFLSTIRATVSHIRWRYFPPLRIVLTSSSAALNRDPYCPSVRTSSIASATAGNRGCLFLSTLTQEISVCLVVAHARR